MLENVSMIVIRHDALVASVAPDDKETLFLIPPFSSLVHLFQVFFISMERKHNTFVYKRITKQNHQNILGTAREFVYI